ncbi:hypothetical protein DUNSADRAFT_11402 [Dunaliella salina]|uniref:Uncharacterized protein n=1 Tax=Dunaliella salina TaxID=3046 RepID=A0ABQ7GDH0_DUNSA|nr:hypothetical protein DUNSADRAFT_11402 [Dunaliella salina]|eukprot:KAF5832657.1 hypothetical protein DUNSADRAFT_11402 [Dunaliella salina]
MQGLTDSYPGGCLFAHPFGRFLGSLPRLRVLRLSGMRADDFGAGFFDGLAVQQDSALRELWLSNCCMGGYADPYWHPICQLSSLRVLSVDHWSHGSDDAIDTPIPFATMSHLECLAIDGGIACNTRAWVSERILPDMVAALPRLTGLQKLALPCVPPAHVALPPTVESLTISEVEQDNEDLPALLAAVSSNQLPAKLHHFCICSLHVREGLSEFDPSELAPRLRVALQGVPCEVDLSLSELAAALRECASVCPDVRVEGVHAITHCSDEEVLEMLEVLGPDFSRALRFLSFAAGFQLLEWIIPKLTDYAPNVSEVSFYEWEPDLVMEALSVMPRLERVCLLVFVDLALCVDLVHSVVEYGYGFQKEFASLCSCVSRIRSASEQPHLTVHLDVLAQDMESGEDGFFDHREWVELRTDDIVREARGPRGVLSGQGRRGAGPQNVSVSSALAFMPYSIPYSVMHGE